jgi:hypothetical protein
LHRSQNDHIKQEKLQAEKSAKPSPALSSSL